MNSNSEILISSFGSKCTRNGSIKMPAVLFDVSNTNGKKLLLKNMLFFKERGKKQNVSTKLNM